MTEYLFFSEYNGKKVVGYHNSAASGSGLTDSNVKDIIIPLKFEEVEVVEVGYRAFSNTEIANVFIPKTVEYLNYGCFYTCSSLRTILFEENIRLIKVDRRAFSRCGSLESLDFPPSVTEIISASGYYQFYLNYAMNCISYFGTSTFTDQYFITTYNSGLVVHPSPSYSGTFGTIPLVKDG